MEIAPYEGIEVFNGWGPEAINGGQHQKFHRAADSSGVLSPKSRLCGLSRTIFWLAITITVLAIIIIGLATGFGVALSKAQNANAYNSMPSSLASTTPTVFSSPPSSSTHISPALTPLSTSTVSSTSMSGGIPQPSNICPGANNTILTPPIGDVRYLVACDSDFGDSGKQTLASFVTATWDDCLDLCNTMNYFQDRADIGCTWNVLGTGTQTPGTCWCLGGADKTVVANRGNVAAVPQ
ncbi:uncharacterized protein B0T15DRAFT_515495 [Chaetomium strumarium]|uniref:Uncharacterized protein n=1 Tax=Chaetomium strumarium TaxID=1170767 RepID=A0AAJ0M5B6_9PEZI|nr:hypothetical protein B0T15DRAFT_515495 [Chaetomium strumarium]